MSKRDHKIQLRDKQNLETRLERTQYPDWADPVFKDSNIHLKISERIHAIGCGGIGALHKLVCKLGLDSAINRNVVLLKTHVPYWESDHVLNIAYNVLTGGRHVDTHRPARFMVGVHSFWRGDGWGPRGEAEAGENFPDCNRWIDSREYPHSCATAGTSENIKFESRSDFARMKQIDPFQDRDGYPIRPHTLMARPRDCLPV